jgi:hypothetical protein
VPVRLRVVVVVHLPGVHDVHQQLLRRPAAPPDAEAAVTLLLLLHQLLQLPPGDPDCHLFRDVMLLLRPVAALLLVGAFLRRRLIDLLLLPPLAVVGPRLHRVPRRPAVPHRLDVFLSAVPRFTLELLLALDDFLLRELSLLFTWTVAALCAEIRLKEWKQMGFEAYLY